MNPAIAAWVRQFAAQAEHRRTIAEFPSPGPQITTKICRNVNADSYATAGPLYPTPGPDLRRGRLWPAVTLRDFLHNPSSRGGGTITITFAPAAVTVTLHRPAEPRIARTLELLLDEINADPSAHTRRHPPNHLPDHATYNLTVTRRLPPEI